MFLQKDKHQYHLFLLKRWFLFFFQKDFLLKKNFPIKNSIFFFSLKDVKLFIHFPNVKSQDFKESKRRKLKKSEEKGINLHHASQKLILLFNFSPEEINQCDACFCRWLTKFQLFRQTSFSKKSLSSLESQLSVLSSSIQKERRTWGNSTLENWFNSIDIHFSWKVLWVLFLSFEFFNIKSQIQKEGLNWFFNSIKFYCKFEFLTTNFPSSFLIRSQ